MMQSDAAALVIWARDPSGAVVGAQRVLLTDDGRKRLVETSDGPAAKFTNGQADRAIIALPCVDPLAYGGALLVVEGPEGAAGVWQASSAETWCVFGVSGWAGLVNLLPRDRRVILCPDADAVGSQAWKAFTKALAAIIEAGVDCYVAATPAQYGPKADLGDVLQCDGEHAVRAVLDNATTEMVARQALPVPNLASLECAKKEGTASDVPFFPYAAPNSERDAVGREMRGFIREWIFSNAGDDTPCNVLIRGSQSLGKSTAARRALADMAGGAALVTYPTREKAHEEYNEYCREKNFSSPKPILYRARAANRSDGGEGPMCERHVEAEEMVKHALPPSLLCDGCPFAAGCLYRAQTKTLTCNAEMGIPMIVFAAHELVFNAPPFTPTFAIIDEMPARNVVRTISRIDPDDFTTNKLHLKDEIAPEAVAKMLTLICAALCDLTTAGAVLAPLRDVIEVTRKAIVYAPEFKPAPTDTATSITQKIDGFRNDYTKGRRLRAALAAVMADIDAGFIAVQSIVQTPSSWTATRIMLPKVSCPILALDGTASPLLSRAWLGDFKDKAYRVERNAHVIQVIGRTYSTRSLTGDQGKYTTRDHKGTFKADAARLRRQLLELVKSTPDAAFVAPKDVVELMRPALPDTVKTAHFNALRGLNSLEHCPIIYILGRLEPPAYEVGRIAGAYGAALGIQVKTDVEYIEVKRRLRMRDGSIESIAVQAHPCAIGDEVLRQIRDAEVEQAADRCRAIYNHRRIFVLSTTVCDFTIDRTISHVDLVNGGNKLERAFVASGGALRLSAAGMSADASEIYSTPNAAKMWKKDQDFEALVSAISGGVSLHIKYLYGEGPPPKPMSICSIKIRKSGHNGGVTRAIIFAQPEDAKKAATEVWGPLASFDLIAVNGVAVATTFVVDIGPAVIEAMTEAGFDAALDLSREVTTAGYPRVGRSIAGRGLMFDNGAGAVDVVEAAANEVGADMRPVCIALGLPCPGSVTLH